MFNEFDKKLMLKFLETNYPVSRVKVNLQFKRTIVLDNGGVFVLSDITHIHQLKTQLIDVLIKVFTCDEPTSRVVIDQFLHLS